MHVFNSEFDRHGDESRAFAGAWSAVQKGSAMDNFSFFLPITKVDKDRRTVSGYASTPTLDLDGEIVSLDAVKKALPGYWEWRNIREMHTNSAIGVAKEANVDGTGLFLTAKIVDEDAWQKCLEQVYKGFSIGGKKLAKTGNTITDIDLVEISVVDRPANPDCRFSVNKRRGMDSNIAAPAHLIKMRTPEEKLLKKISKAMDLLAKAKPEEPVVSGTQPRPAGPPAARDGFSLPAKVKKNKKCAAHGLKGCPMCMGKAKPPAGPSLSPIDNNPFTGKAKVKKREFSSEQRDRLAGTGAAMPDGSFPIANRSDLDNARQAVGRAKNPGQARAHIRSRAAALGVTLPEGWSKKNAKLLIKIAELEKAAEMFDLEGHMTLSKRGPDLDLKKSVKTTTDTADFELGVTDMPENVSLDQVLESLIKRGKVVTKAQHLQIAKSNIKKARKARMDAMDNIKAAHAMHKSAYLSKASKASKPKPPTDDDADDFDHTGAMEKLGKAYQSLDSVKTFMKAATMHLKKAASRSGQRGEEVGDGKAPWYTPPAGVHDMSQSELATAGPGGDNHGSTPAILDMETVYPGKSAKKSANNGLITSEHAQALVRAAAAEAEANLLKSMPANNGRRPVAFDVSKLSGSNDTTATARLLEGVDANGLVSDEEHIRKSAVGRLIGNMITNGQGRSVFDPNFHGSAGG
jgi:hypothetical protein